VTESFQPDSEQDKQKQLFESIIAPHPTVIAIEGGPCGGKTTLLNELQAISHEHSRPFVLIPEVATKEILKLVKQGTDFVDLALNYDRFIAFETNILHQIIKNINQAKQEHAGTNAIIVVDRSDVKPYLDKKDYQQILTNLELNLPPIIDLIDKVVYLPTVARSAPGVYQQLMVSNPSRYENVTDAITTCDRNLQAAIINPEVSIYSDNDFKTKIDRALFDILNPEIEIETKFTADDSQHIVDVFEMLNQISNRYLNTVELYQTYHQIEGQEFRLRHGVVDEEYDFYHMSIKQTLGYANHELRRTLNLDEYELLYSSQHSDPLHKWRSRFLYEFEDRQYILSLDYYDQLQKIMIEIEGMDQLTASRVNIKGFNIGGLSASDLVQ